MKKTLSIMAAVHIASLLGFAAYAGDTQSNRQQSPIIGQDVQDTAKPTVTCTQDDLKYPTSHSRILMLDGRPVCAMMITFQEPKKYKRFSLFDANRIF